MTIYLYDEGPGEHDDDERPIIHAPGAGGDPRCNGRSDYPCIHCGTNVCDCTDWQHYACE